MQVSEKSLMSNDSGSNTIEFNCAHCNTKLSAPAAQAGTSIACSGCQASVTVPVVASSVVESPAPVATATPAVQAAAESPAPVTSAGAQPAMAESTAVMASSEAIDPNASPEFKAAVQPISNAVASVPRPRADYREAYASKPKSNRAPVMVLGAVVVSGVLLAVGVTISNNMERAKIEDNITDLLSKSDAAFKKNDVDGALTSAKSAQTAIEKSSQPLDDDKKKKWDTQIKHVVAIKDQLSKLDAIFGGASKDLPATRDRLLDMQRALTPVTDDNRPAAVMLDSLLEKVAQLELKAKVQKVEAALEEANKLYATGKIAAAADKADLVARDLLVKPVVQNPEIESRINVLKKRADTLKEAEKTQQKATTGKYAEALKDVNRQLQQIDGEKEDLKPLHESLTAIVKRLKEQERLSKKLSPDDEKDIRILVTSMSRMDPNLAPQASEGDTVGMSVSGKSVRLGVYHSDKERNPLPGEKLPAKNLFVEVNGYRFLVNAQQILPKDAIPEEFVLKGEEAESQRFRSTRVLLHAYNLGEAMKKAGVPTETLWEASSEAPLVSARRVEGGKEYVFLGDKLYVGTPEGKSEERARLRADYEKKCEVLEKAVQNDKPTSEEVRNMVAEAIHAAYKEADWSDHLPGEFLRKVIADDYIQRNMPGSAERLKKELTDWRDAYTALSKPTFNFSGNSEQGDSATEFKTLESHPVWRIYDKAGDTTTFAIDNPDEEKDCMFVLYDFAGNVENFPETATPKQVRMTHQAVGVTATYDPAANKMTSDKERWSMAAALELPAMSSDYRNNKGLGDPSWAFPPHILLIDYNRYTRAIVTPFGKLEMRDFRKVPADKRKAEMDAFIGQMATVMPTANYLHLYFRYFHEYVLDSPVTSQLELLGSRTHCGDIHQTAYQSLERYMGGRLVGDCDDLAETFMTITRRQGKLSYVMALPQHAACGWAEKKPGESEYTFQICDTGPPRLFRDRDLDKVIEKAERAYDDEHTMRFDPKSLGFLFRFNNEPTRTPYYLSSRMFVDKEYGDAMERVQSYWHFHFYKLGIETMTAMINKGDRVPENCIELAGLYGWIREVEDSIKWTNEALKQFGPEEKLSRMNEEMRIGSMWRTEHENQKAYDAIKPTVKELVDLYKSRESFNYTSMRLQFMHMLIAIDRPFEAWDLVAREMIFFAQRGQLRIDHAGGLTTMYKKMKEVSKEGTKLTAAQRDAMGTLEKVLGWFYTEALFQKDDDFNDIMRKYAFLGLWYSCKEGQEKYVAELLKDGPFPDPKKPRDHTDRKNAEEEDWNWIRLSLTSYSLAIGDALDFDDPPEKWRKDEAVKLADAMKRAAEHTKQFGSLAGEEFALMSTQVFRDFMVKDWKDLEKVVQDTGQRDWARLTQEITDAFGHGARFVTPDEFVQQYRMLTKYIHSRPAYFAVITEAYKTDGVEQAVAATKVAVECNPGDEDMKREAAFFTELAKKKLAKKSAVPAPKPDDKQPAKNGQ
jgi:outer membrane murein-binding lipoprotein Lpp